MEMGSTYSNKGTALIELAKILDIPMMRVMAIGDNDNDVEMLKVAGMGVVMGNFTLAAKKVATVMTRTCAEDGAAYAIQCFCEITLDGTTKQSL